MTTIFISYSRSDETFTHGIVKDVQDLGYKAWFDRELSGGQHWWKRILDEIRKADIFLFILSPESRQSTACKREYEYAFALEKPIIPVMVRKGISASMLPPALSAINFVEYLKPDDKASSIALARSLSAISDFKPLPDPLPEPPEVPISYIGDLARKIEDSSELSKEEQSDLLMDIESLLDEPGTATGDALSLLRTFRRRHDLYARTGDKIDRMIKAVEESPRNKVSRAGTAPEAATQHGTPAAQPRKDTKLSVGLIILIGAVIYFILYLLALV